MYSVNNSSIGNSSSWNTLAPTSTLTDDEADALYFECRDTNYSHEQAATYVRANGGSSAWIEPRPTDYQGLPDVQQASNSNVGRSGFDRMIAMRQSPQAESSMTGGQSNAILPPGINIRNQEYRDVKHPATSLYVVSCPYTRKIIESFNTKNQLGLDVAKATNRALKARYYKGRGERPKRIDDAKRKGNYAVVLQYLNNGCPDR
jgi:hypothetical protein